MLPIAGVIRVDTGFSISGDNVTKSRWFVNYVTGPPSSANLDTCAAALDVYAADNFPAMMDSDTTYTGTELMDLSSDSGAIGAAATPAVGTRGGNPLPASAALVADYKILRRYRGGHPKNFLPWGSSDDLTTAQTWAADFIAPATAVWAGYRDTLIGNLVGAIQFESQVSVHYFEGYTLGPASSGGFRKRIPTPVDPPTFDNVVATSYRVTVGSQRRRLTAG
jgi:hypothetical protein